jgi:hypothetical protein
MDLATTNDKSLKGFWERTEGTWGMAIIALLGVGGLFLAKALLPTIISVLTMGVTAVGQGIVLATLCALLAAILYILFATPLPKLVGYYFKANVRRLTSVFVSVYPIEIMKDFISKLSAKKQLFTDKKADIAKVKKNIEETVKSNQKEREDALFKVKAAQKQSMPMEAQLAARQAGMLEDAIKRLNASLTTVSGLYTTLERVEKVCDFKIRDMQFQVKMLDQDNKTSKAIKGAVSAAAAILRGSDSDQELYDSAVEYVIEDYRNSLGLIDDFMSSTDSILNGFDLQNGMWEERALEQLAQLDHKEQILLGNTPSAQMTVITPVVTDLEHVPLPSADLTSKYLKS